MIPSRASAATQQLLVRTASQARAAGGEPRYSSRGLNHPA